MPYPCHCLWRLATLVFDLLNTPISVTLGNVCANLSCSALFVLELGASTEQADRRTYEKDTRNAAYRKEKQTGMLVYPTSQMFNQTKMFVYIFFQVSSSYVMV